MVDHNTPLHPMVIQLPTDEAKKMMAAMREEESIQKTMAYSALFDAVGKHYHRISHAGKVRLVERLFDCLSRNPSTAPYHNNYHAYCMVNNCNSIAHSWSNMKGVYSDDFILHLLVAAMFHDYGHSGGVKTDDVNIGRACDYVFDALTPIFGIDFVDTVLPIIEVTQFPFLVAPTNLIEKIIRDADLIQSSEPCYVFHVYYGLFKEISLSQTLRVGNADGFTLKAFAEGQHTFINNAQFYTSPNPFLSGRRELMSQRCTPEQLEHDMRLLHSAFPDLPLGYVPAPTMLPDSSDL